VAIPVSGGKKAREYGGQTRLQPDTRAYSAPLTIPRGGDSLGRMERHSMRKIREVLRVRASGLEHARRLGLDGRVEGTVSDYLRRAHDAELDWNAAVTTSDVEVEAQLFKAVGRSVPPRRAPIDMAWVHRELRKTDATLQLLWSEYVAAIPAERGTLPVQSVLRSLRELTHEG
jgi:hypothetical protein